MSQRRFSDPVEEQDIAASADRRDGDRYRTVWRIAKVMRNGDAGLWRVRNLFHHRLMIAAGVQIAVGGKLENQHSNTVALPRDGLRFQEGPCGASLREEVACHGIAHPFAATPRHTPPTP